MSHSDSDSDSFLSADEFANDNEDDIFLKDNQNFKNNNVDIKNDTLISVSPENKNCQSNYSEEELELENKTIPDNKHEENTISEEACEVRTYRKRPERLKKTTEKDSPKPKAVDFIPHITDITKVTRSDVLTDLTHQFASKLSRGLATFQEKSSSLKGFVQENLVADTNKFEGNKFVYDEDRTKDLTIEDSSVVQDIPKSNINDEILKLSNAFAKLNEKSKAVECSGACLQQSDFNEISVSCSIDKHICSETIDNEGSSDNFDKLVDEQSDPSLRNSNTDVSSDHQETYGWDECIEEALLPEIKNESVSILSQSDQVAQALCQEDPKVATEDVNTDGWEDMLDGDDEANEETVGSNDQSIEDCYKIDNKDKLLSHNEGELKREILDNKSTEEKPVPNECQETDLDEWDDWEIDSEDEQNCVDTVKDKTESHQQEATPQEPSHSQRDTKSDEQDGWDDWGDDEFTDIPQQEEPAKLKEARVVGSQAMKSSNVSKPKEWSGWDSFGQKKENDWNLGGWGINTLLSTATAVTTNLSAAIESGLGVPDPQTMARIAVEEEKKSKDKKVITKEESISEVIPGQFPFQHIVAGVGKIVEVAKVQEIGSRVLSGGLDTLESIGKKTMEVLQEGDPGLKKKRALIAEQGQMLSKVLKEARDKAMEEDRHSKEMKIERRCHFETLFDDFQGLVHLEALEMLSRQCELRLEQIQESLPPDRRKELQETLEEVRELCEVDEEFDDVEVDNFEEAISEVVAPLKNELSVNKIIEVHKRLSEWLLSESIVETEANELYDKAISTMAELTAAITMQFHKSGELLILKERRKTVEEADCLMQLSSHLCYEVKTLTNSLEGQLNKKTNGDIHNLVKNLQEECENAVGYIKQAFKLLVPVIQLGAS